MKKPEKIAQRMLSQINEIKKNHEGQSIAIVSHGDPLAFLKAFLLHPGKTLPSLIKLDYLKKGTMWKIVVDKRSKVIEKNLVS